MPVKKSSTTSRANATQPKRASASAEAKTKQEDIAPKSASTEQQEAKAAGNSVADDTPKPAVEAPKHTPRSQAEKVERTRDDEVLKRIPSRRVWPD